MRRLPLILGLLVIAVILYLPARREALNRGWAPSGTFVSTSGTKITVYGDGTFRKRHGSKESQGRFATERFPDIPYVSLLRLDDGELLHVRYDNKAHWLDQITDLSSADETYRRL
jgi:hypothetical protein